MTATPPRALRAALAAAALAAAPPAAAASLLEAEQPAVREGNERLLQGDAAGALERYDAAERVVGPRPELDYDRGVALHRAGRYPEARDAFRRALERAPGALASRSHQNAGNALARAGDLDGAIAAYSDALRSDPANQDARHDLEVLLRRKAAGAGPPPPPSSGQRPGPRRPGPEQRPGDEARPGERDEPRPGEGEEPRPAPDGRDPQGDARPPPAPDRAGAGAGAQEAAPGDGAAGDPQPGGARDAQREARAAPLARQEAEQLLDALRARERTLPMGGRARKEGRRSDDDRDW